MDPVRAARNQALFRSINERIEDLNRAFERLTLVGDWVCECADLSCIELMSLSLEEYEAIRQHPARFPIVGGHEVLEVERVVERHDRYIVVEKIGEGRIVAEQSSPR